MERKRRCSSSVSEVNGTLKKTFWRIRVRLHGDPRAALATSMNRARGALVPMSTGSLVIFVAVSPMALHRSSASLSVSSRASSARRMTMLNIPCWSGDYLMLQGVSPTSDNPEGRPPDKSDPARIGPGESVRAGSPISSPADWSRHDESPKYESITVVGIRLNEQIESHDLVTLQSNPMSMPCGCPCLFLESTRCA